MASGQLPRCCRAALNRAADTANNIAALHTRGLGKPRMMLTRPDCCQLSQAGRQHSAEALTFHLFELCRLERRRRRRPGLSGAAPGWPALLAAIVALRVASAGPSASAALSGSWAAKLRIALLGRWSGSLRPHVPRVAWRVITNGQRKHIREILYAPLGRALDRR